MTIDHTLKWNGERLGALLMRAADTGAEAAARVLTETIQSGLGGVHYGRRSRPGAMPHTQTRQLRQSFSHTAGSGGAAHVFTRARYAVSLALGAVIAPRGRSLVIPMSWEAQRLMTRSDGSARAAIASLQAMRGFARRRTVSGGWLLGLERGRGRARTFTPWFLLTRRTVTIAPRPWHSIALARGREPMRRAAIAAMVSTIRGGAL